MGEAQSSVCHLVIAFKYALVRAAGSQTKVMGAAEGHSPGRGHIREKGAKEWGPIFLPLCYRATVV